MNKVVLLARIVLGFVFFVLGLNGFLNFLPPPEVPAGPAQEFMGGLAGSGYFFPLLKLTETVSGALLLAGFYVPLALTLLASVVVNIALYHFVLDPSAQGLVMALVILALEIFLAWAYRDSFKGVLQQRGAPTV